MKHLLKFERPKKDGSLWIPARSKRVTNKPKRPLPQVKEHPTLVDVSWQQFPQFYYDWFVGNGFGMKNDRLYIDVGRRIVFVTFRGYELFSRHQLTHPNVPLTNAMYDVVKLLKIEYYE